MSAYENTVYDQLAELGREHREIGGEPCDADDQVGIFRRILVRVEHLLLIHDVDVDERASHFEVGFDNRANQFRIFLVRERGVEFPLHRRRVAVAGLDACDDGCQRKRSPVGNEPRRGIRPVRNRRPGPPAVGCRPDASAEPYRIGPGEESGDEAAAEFRFGFAAYQGRELVFDSQRPAFPGRSFRSVASAVAELQPDLFTFRTGKIVEQGSGNLFPCQVFLPFDMLFERRKGIGDDCQPGAVDRKVVVFRSAVRYIHPFSIGPWLSRLRSSSGSLYFWYFR